MQKKTKQNARRTWPRERLVSQGVANLSDQDLIALILRTGGSGKNVLELSNSLLRKKALLDWSKATVGEWLQIPGIDLAKAAALVAAFELASRINARTQLHPSVVSTPSAAATHFHHLRDKRKEYLAALYLNARHEVVHKEVISIGLVDRSLIHPRELFAPALAHMASAVILGHNHPSGNTEPSEDDLVVTRSLVKAAQLLQLTLLDHLIITADNQLSLREWGMVELQPSSALTSQVGDRDIASTSQQSCVY